MRIGIDSYSYHRLLGELRPGERPPEAPFRRGALDVLDHARGLGVAAVSLETCFLEPPGRLDPEALREAADGLELVLAWGHPHGLEFGASETALDDLLAWLELAPALRSPLVRLVAASPRFRGAEPVGMQIARTAAVLARTCARARELGLALALALENHGDLTASQLAELLDRVGDETLGVCLDTANALRVGDDPLEAARLLAPAVRMVHLKDVEPLEHAADPIAGPCSVAYGDGVVALRDVLGALGGSAFDGLVCVEIAQLREGADELGLVERCVAWLRGYASSNG